MLICASRISAGSTNKFEETETTYFTTIPILHDPHVIVTHLNVIKTSYTSATSRHSRQPSSYPFNHRHSSPLVLFDEVQPSVQLFGGLRRIRQPYDSKLSTLLL